MLSDSEGRSRSRPKSDRLLELRRNAHVDPEKVMEKGKAAEEAEETEEWTEEEEEEIKNLVEEIEGLVEEKWKNDNFPFLLSELGNVRSGSLIRGVKKYYKTLRAFVEDEIPELRIVRHPKISTHLGVVPVYVKEKDDVIFAENLNQPQSCNTFEAAASETTLLDVLLDNIQPDDARRVSIPFDVIQKFSQMSLGDLEISGRRPLEPPIRRPQPARPDFHEILGHDFADPDLLEAALTYSKTPKNKRRVSQFQRLEFLGDRVLGLVIAEYLVRDNPDLDEGALNRNLAVLVWREALAEVARATGLDRAVRRARDESEYSQRMTSKAPADACETVIGALFLDGGLDAARTFVLRHWRTLISRLPDLEISGRRPPKPPIRRPQPARQDFREILGHDFADPGLLEAALTYSRTSKHKGSVSQFRRLEFLGYRVLWLVIAEYLVRDNPDLDEGALDRRFAALVRREALAVVARATGLDRAVRHIWDQSENSGRMTPKAPTDACEAVIGALFLDGGLDAARAFVLRHWRPLISRLPDMALVDPTALIDPKTALRKRARAMNIDPPRYTILSQGKPGNRPVFEIGATLADGRTGTGRGFSQRNGERAAARALLLLLDHAEAADPGGRDRPIGERREGAGPDDAGGSEGAGQGRDGAGERGPRQWRGCPRA